MKPLLSVKAFRHDVGETADRPFIKAVCTMSDWNEDSGYYCLLIAILCGVDAAESKLLYKYGPGHPLCKKILKKKLTAKETEGIGECHVPAPDGRIYAGRDLQCLWLLPVHSKEKD